MPVHPGAIPRSWKLRLFYAEHSGQLRDVPFPAASGARELPLRAISAATLG